MLAPHRRPPPASPSPRSSSAPGLIGSDHNLGFRLPPARYTAGGSSAHWSDPCTISHGRGVARGRRLASGRRLRHQPDCFPARSPTRAASRCYQARVTVLEANRTTTTDLEGHYTVPELPARHLRGELLSDRLRAAGPPGDALPTKTSPRRVAQALAGRASRSSGHRCAGRHHPAHLAPAGQRARRIRPASSRSATLGETVSALPGVRSFSTGAGIGKPVIRGLSSNRVLVLADGERVESQQWGDEHGPADRERARPTGSRSSAVPPACSTARTRSAESST